MILNRRHIRIKVMQVLFAFPDGESSDIKRLDNFLVKSFDATYDLYLSMMSLFLELQKKAEDHQEKLRNKFTATKEEKNPNLKFVNNQVLGLMMSNEPLKNALETHKINNWYLDFEYVDILFKAIIESDLYVEFMKTKTSNFHEDKRFLAAIFQEIIAPNDKLYEYFEDKNITWLDDLPVVNTTILKVLNKVKPKSQERHFTPRLFKDADDKEFGQELLKTTILNQSSFSEEIASKTTNWDAERITRVDTILMQMAICEFTRFPSIPVKVTLNEYLEIAKEYSTPKSSNFINGILDKILKEYSKENKLNKIRRGLL